MENKTKKATPRRGEYTARVIEQRKFGVGHKILCLELEGTAAKCFGRARAGQFVQIACRDLADQRRPVPLLRRPFSIAGLHPGGPDKQDCLSLEIIYRIIGPGTKWLERCLSGDILNILGPLGNGFTLGQDPKKRAILLGGGIGLPPMFFLADQLAQSGYGERVAFAGARMKSHLEGTIDTRTISSQDLLTPQMHLEQFKRSNTGCIIATDDGSAGYCGNITQVLEEFLEKNSQWQEGQIYACGPDAMLKAVAELALKRDMPCQLCLEAYMACGIGVCQSCVVPVQNSNNSAEEENSPETKQYKLVCTHGPVFDARSIVWDKLEAKD